MRKPDLYWKSNRDWREYDKDFYPVLTENAPKEAWESYLRYLIQKRRKPRRWWNIRKPVAEPLELGWLGDADWWELGQDRIPHLKETAPKEAWESYLRYPEQTDR